MRRSWRPGSSWPRPTRWGCCGAGASLGFLLPFTVAAIAIPIQMVVGDSTARAVYDEQPWIQMIIVPRSAIREAIAA